MLAASRFYIKLILIFSIIQIRGIVGFAQSALNDTLVKQLDAILRDDQIYREQRDSIQRKFGANSKELQNLYVAMKNLDSINIVKVEAIIDKFGWLGPDVVGKEGNQTLFLVIQHANLETQKKYLQVVRNAVKMGKAQSRSLALFEDRIALAEGKMQIYGSQVGLNTDTNEYFVFPLIDPDNVNKRRATMGLPGLEEYLSRWQIKWDVTQYKKDLPRIIAMTASKQ